MKQFLNVRRLFLVPVLGVMALVFFLASCKKNDVEPVYQPAAGLMAFNLAPDKVAIGFTLSGNQLGNQPLGYSNYTGVYLPVYVASREVRSFDFNSGSTIATSNGDFADSMFYSVFLVGANGVYRNLVVNDQLETLNAVAGKAWVRYINAIPDSTAPVSVTIGEGTTAEAAPYASVSAFRQVDAGSVNTGISNGGNISATRSITVEADKVYTILFSGIPGQSDPAKAVQIRFIENGRITP